MPNLPDFEAWAIFARVAELGSFSAASTELAVSKATISKALTRLEARLGTPLFHRSSRRLSLTESGRASLDRARRILAEGEAVEDEATEQTREPRGLVRLTAPLSFGVQTLGPVLPEFLAGYPQVSVDLQLTDRRVDLVAEGVDLALRIGILADSALRARKLYEVPICLVASPVFVARHGHPAHPRDLERYSALVFTHLTVPSVWQFRHPAEGDYSVRVTGRLMTDNGDVAIPALVAGIGLALMPHFLIWQLLRAGTLMELIPAWKVAPAGLHLVTPPGALRPARVTALMEFLGERFKRAPWDETGRDPAASPPPGR